MAQNIEIKDHVRGVYEQLFGHNSHYLTVFSPGRINLIGEHTDYNNGFVMPAAIDKGIYMAIGHSKDQSYFNSLNMNESYSPSIKEPLEPLFKGGWENYIIGVIHQLKQGEHSLGEVNIVFAGDLAIGAGLSSSAALENAVGVGLNELFDLGISKPSLAKLSQKAEHQFAGVKCGIMDQYASMMGLDNAAILLDCQSLHFQEVPIELDDYAIVLCNSNVSHTLANSEYNVRHEQCENGVSIIQTHYPEVRSLRDVTLAMLAKHRSLLDPIVYKRCAYVIEENERVHSFAKALEKKDFMAAGNILYAAHAGMRHKYEITCKEIDFMVDFTKTHEAVMGARMMGGGFGGCTLNMVLRDKQDEFIESLGQAYLKEVGIEMTHLTPAIGSGSRLI